jgi:hypothetical protein
MEKSLFDSCSPGQVILRPWRNPKVHYLVDKNLPVDAILSELNPVHNLMSHVFNIR